MNQVGRVARETVHRVEQISSDLCHPGAVRSDTNPGDVHGAGPELDDKEDHDADRAERTDGLDAEKVASVERLPVALDELLPSPLSNSLGCRLEADLRQDAGDRRATDLDLEPTERVSDLGVALTSVVRGKLEHEIANLVRFAWFASPLLLRAVILGRRELAEPF